MADLLKAAKDPKFREDVIRGLGETFSRGVAGIVGAPVDIATMAMRPFGYNVPAEQVVGGSEYIGKQMEEAGLISSARRPAAEFLANVVTPDPMDVARLGAMAVPVVGRAMREAPRDEAMRIAQANAAKPVSEGGLGLPPDNTAMDRAKAMGFETEAFHGTNRNFPSFSNQMLGAKTGAKSAQKAHFSTASPELAGTYANLEHVYPFAGKDVPPVYEKLVKNKQAFKEFNEAPDTASQWAVLEKYGMSEGSGQIMPLLLNLGKSKVKDYQGKGYRDETYNDILKAAKKQKKDSATFLRTYDPGPYVGGNPQTDVYAVFDPANIRSRFAAFDPARRYESDLLGAADPRLLAGVAGATGAGLYGASRMQEGEERPQPRFGFRPDGTPKGEGWLGVLPLADGNLATEYSMQSQAVKVGDQMVDFPTLVPTLNQEEVNLMLSDIIPNRKPIPEPIVQKAIKHAKQRLDKGLSPFKELGE